MGRLATAKAIHICNSHEPPLDQKLQKSMSCHLTKKMKLVANLKDRYMEMKQCQCLTKAICNAGKVLNINIVAINKMKMVLPLF